MAAMRAQTTRTTMTRKLTLSLAAMVALALAVALGGGAREAVAQEAWMSGKAAAWGVQRWRWPSDRPRRGQGGVRAIAGGYFHSLALGVGYFLGGVAAGGMARRSSGLNGALVAVFVPTLGAIASVAALLPALLG